MKLGGRMARWWRTGLIGLALVGMACSSTSSPEAAPGSSSSSRAADRGASARPQCRPTRATPPEVVPVDDSDSELTMTSFDGSEIRLHWYPLDRDAPTVLMGPGWSSPGARLENGGTGLFGDAPVSALRDQGYHVLTWDPRGFGESTGTITIDSADFEGRDVRRMLDWLATQDRVELDGPGDPRVGMVGGSYGGGIQFATASTDCRVDVLVPTIAWHSLATSLYKADTVKIGWSTTLYAAAASRDLDPHIPSAYESGSETGVISEEDAEWFRARGPADSVGRITAPTLLIQGTVDTLFTLDEAATNYELLRRAGTPVALLWYCGGHGACFTDEGDATRPATATENWLRRWLVGDESVETGPRVDVIDQRGDRFTAPDWPLRTGPPLVGTGSGELELTAEGGAGPADPASAQGTGGAITGIAAGITPARADNAVEVTLTARDTMTSVGAPRLALTYSGSAPAGVRPTRVFAQLVDDTTGNVLGNQITPIRVILDGAPHRVTVPLEMIGHTLAPGDSVTLQIVATTVAYAPPRLGGRITFSKIRVELPNPADLTPER